MILIENNIYDMKKLLFTLSLVLSYTAINAQVGIGTNTPVTDLDVESRAIAAGEFNGVLIPRVAAIPGVVAPAGTLIYVTGGATPGFYFSNGTAYINVTDTLTATGPFFESGTTTTASNNTQNIFRTGQTSLGEDLAGPQLYVGSTAIVGSPRTTVGIRNLNTSTALSNTYSLDLNNLSSTTATKYGIRNNVSSSGVGEHIGIENTVFDSGLASTSVTGILNDVGATAGTSSENYGIRTEIGSASSRGTNYAIYAYSQHGTTTSDPSYSGYFRGDRFAIRSEDDSDGYEMPTVDGTAGQVLTTDGTGNASWQGNGAKEYLRADVNSVTNFTINNPNQSNFVDDWADVVYSVETNASTSYDNTNGVFTAPYAGVFHIKASIASDFDPGGTDRFGIAVLVDADGGNNSYVFFDMEELSHNGNGRVFRSITTAIELAQGANIKIQFLMPDNYLNFTVDEFGAKTNIIITEQ